MRKPFLHGRCRTRTLGRDRQRASVAKRIDGRFHSLDRLGRVGTVDENDPHRSKQGTEDGVATNLLLADRRHVATHELGDQDSIETTLVIEDEHRRSMRPEMFLALHPQVNTGQRGCEVSPHRTDDIDGLAMRTVPDTEQILNDLRVAQRLLQASRAV